MNKIIVLFSAIIFLGCNWGSDNKCSSCACSEGCCDSGACAVQDCSCSCKK